MRLAKLLTTYVRPEPAETAEPEVALVSATRCSTTGITPAAIRCNGDVDAPSPTGKGKIITLPTSVLDWPEYWREEYEERAAIIEFCGNKPRRAAESEAISSARLRFRTSQTD